MSKKAMVLGYTRNGIEVRLPTDDSADVEDLAGWGRGDHADAGRILVEHSERERGSEAGIRCARWAKAHKAVAKRHRRDVRVLGAAETTILRGRRGN